MTTSRILDLREDEIGRFPREMISDGEVWALKNSDKFEVEALIKTHTVFDREAG
jgi:hypothetical protein